MKVTKAVITAAGKGQRNLPLQTLIDRDGQQKSVLSIILDEVVRANIHEICLVINPRDEDAYRLIAGDHAGQISFVYQDEPRGYGHAVLCAKAFTHGDPFLHLIGDHLYVSRMETGCAQRVVKLAELESCAISAVQATREGLLPNFGAVGGKRLQGRNDLYSINTVIEKPTPTEAEQQLLVPGLRAGYYLCFFGIHVLTPTVMELLDQQLKASPHSSLPTISYALQQLAQREKYLGMEMNDQRYNIGTKYGLFNAQLALALNGNDRDSIIAMLMEMLLLRERNTGKESSAR
jgi:UTP--glucose-1-phosphate uridylyltransferase